MNGLQRICAFVTAVGIAQAAVIDVNGKVVDASGNPVADAKVRLGRAAISAYTLADGTFRISEIAGTTTQGTPISALPFASWVQIQNGQIQVHMNQSGTFQLKVWSAQGSLISTQRVTLTQGDHQVQVGSQPHQWSVLDVEANGQRAFTAWNGVSYSRFHSLPLNEPLGQALTLGGNVDTVVVSKVLFANDTVDVPTYMSNLGTLVLAAELAQPNANLIADSLYAQGLNLHNSGQYNFAIGYLDAAIAKGLSGSKIGDAAYYRADSYYHEGAYDQALAGYTSVISASATTKKSAAQLGIGDVWMIKSYRDSLLYPTARAEYQKVQSNYAGAAEIPDAIQAIGETYYFEKNYSASIPQFDQILNNYKSTRVDLMPSALYYKGRSLMSQATPDYTTAMTLFGQIISGYPTSVKMDNAKYSLAKCYYLKTPADYATALTKFLDFRTSYPKSSYQDESYKYTSYIYVKQGNCAKAKTERDDFKTLFPASPYFSTTDAYVTANCP